MKISLILFAVSLRCVSPNCMPNFTLLNETTRACPDSNLVFECNVLGPGSTVFQGNRLNCNHSANEILLLHRRFNASNDNYAICKDGNIYAHITDKTSSNCYTSKLYVNISPAMVGEKFNIECIHDNGLNTSMVGNFSIEVIQCNAAMATTVTTQTTLTGVITVTTVDENTNTTSYKAINSLSSGETLAIVLSSLVFLVGAMVTVIILIILWFIFKKKQLKKLATNVIQDVPISAVNRQPSEKTFRCVQQDEASGYSLCVTGYDQIVIITDDSEYSHLQHPTTLCTLGRMS